VKLTLEEKALLRRAILGFAIFNSVLLIGTMGYVILSNSTFVDSLYMTVITVTTIGFGEVVDTSKNYLLRIWTMVVALGGVGMITYLITGLTAVLVNGSLAYIIKKRVMEYKINQLTEHFMVCGMGRVGSQIVQELIEEKLPFVCSDLSEEKILQLQRKLQQPLLYHLGDCTEEDNLLKMNILKAKGIFVATDNDNTNLVICVAARHLAPQLKIVAMVKDPKHTNKLYSVGAQKVICPSFIGGLRMSAEMVKPDLVTFLDSLLRGNEKSAKLNEVEVNGTYALSELSESALVLAIVRQNEYFIKPSKNEITQPGDRLVVLCTKDEKKSIENLVS
jgi:voltage-gated potassium channel